MTQSSIEVSVLIPCFNAEQWVGKAIQSALDQSQQATEVIVLDDGSTDSSRSVIEGFGDRIRCEFHPNRGGNVARNALTRLARGKWLQFLDADDYLTSDKIATQLACVDGRSDIDVVYSPVRTESWTNGTVSDSTIGAIDTTATLEEQWIRWQVAQTGAVLWRRDSLASIGGWNEEYPCCQDNEVTLRAIQSGLKFQYCPDAGAVYRIWSEETVCRKDPRKVIDWKTKLIDDMLKWLSGSDRLTASVAATAGQAFFEMARTLAKFNLVIADSYHADRRQLGYYVLRGPAAPWSYRVAHRIGGFSFAEKLASWRRN